MQRSLTLYVSLLIPSHLRSFERAEPGEGEEETELYSPCGTPEAFLTEWGVGVGLYFKTLRILAVILLITGLVNITNIHYFTSDEYNSDKSQAHLRLILRGTAICMNREWVECLDCNEDQWRLNPEAFASTNNNGTGQVYIQMNLCDGATIIQGMINFGSLIFCMVSIILLGMYQRASEKVLDEGKLTAVDYSVIVQNPPPDAKDPEGVIDVD